MITTIAALYVTLPALFALACYVYSLACPKRFSVAPSESTVVLTAIRDGHAVQAIRALHMARAYQARGMRGAADVWAQVAVTHRMRAIRVAHMVVS